MPRTKSPFPPVEYNSFQLSGGLDLVTPTLSLPAGVARDALNFEVSITGGYSRIAGYERFDGRAAPSDAALGAFSLTSSSLVSVGATITTLGGASAKVVALDPDGLTVYYTMLVGAFIVGNTVLITGSPVGTIVTVGSNASALAGATYQAAAADAYRALIQPVPGSGPVRGVAYFGGTLYAWRDNAGATALRLYKSTSTGWSLIAATFELAFTAGTAVIVDGVTVTGGTSGATGVVARTVLDSGVWGSTAAGRLILSSTTGTFTAGEALKVATVSKATGSGAATALTWSPGGKVLTFAANFGGAQSNKLYGADGVNRGFEFDGTTLVPIHTGMAVDTPVNVAVHKNYLFYSFANSVQFSALAQPYQWTAILGAGEIVVDDTVTAMQILPGDQSTGAMAIYTPANTYILYGTSASTFQLVPFNTGIGAAYATVQNLEQSYSLADRGVVSMDTTRKYGNFDTDTLTFAVRPFVQAHRGKAVASGLNREKSQYRVFYNDGYGLYVTINNGKCLGSMPVFFVNPVTCCAEGMTNSTAAESSFFGSTNGYVYKMDTGPSADGVNLDFSLRLNFNSFGNARVVKRFRKAALEVNGSNFAQFSVGYSVGYADSTVHDAPVPYTYGTNLGQPYWDHFVWDNFYWDGRSLAPVEIELVGSAENLALQIYGSSSVIPAFTINTTAIHYTPRRGLR